jgi:Na+/serine symporter
MDIDADLNQKIGLFSTTMVAVAYKVLKTKTKISRVLVITEVLWALLVAFVIAPAIQDWWKISDPVTLAVACIIVLFSTKLFTKAENYIDSWGSKGGNDES